MKALEDARWAFVLSALLLSALLLSMPGCGDGSSTEEPSGGGSNGAAASSGSGASSGAGGAGFSDPLAGELWVSITGSEYEDRIDAVTALALDPSGDLIVGGGSYDDAYLAKFTPDGAPVWQRDIYDFDDAARAAVFTDPVHALGIDAAGNILVMGGVNGEFPGQVQQTDQEMYLAKYSPDGERVWVEQFPFDGLGASLGLYVDGKGNVTLGGGVNGTLYGQEEREQGPFAIRYDANGVRSWARHVGFVHSDAEEGREVTAGRGLSATADELGNAYVVGEGAFTSDFFITKLDAQGNELWFQVIARDSIGEITALAASADGSALYVAGKAEGGLRGEAGHLSDAFLLRLDGDGVAQWAWNVGELDSFETAVDIALSPDQSTVFLLGEIEGELEGRTPRPGRELLLASFTSSGELGWLDQRGAAHLDLSAGQIAATAEGDVFVGGSGGYRLSSEGWVQRVTERTFERGASDPRAATASYQLGSGGEAFSMPYYGAAVDIDGGPGHTCVVTDRGSVMCWGNGTEGQLGDGRRQHSLVPVEVSGLPGNATSVAVGAEHSCALLDTGGVVCWGANGSGQLGNGTTQPSATPLPALAGSAVSQLAAASNRTCALTREGAADAVQCWGGEAVVTRPTPLPGAAGEISAIAVSSARACSLGAERTLRCWLGDASEPSEAFDPLLAGELASVDESSTCAVTLEGDVYCGNAPGRLVASTPGIEVVALSVQGNDGCALGAGGELPCWGVTGPFYRSGGGLRDLAGWWFSQQITHVALGGAVCVIADGRPWCWGEGNRIGDGNDSDSINPARVLGFDAGQRLP